MKNTRYLTVVGLALVSIIVWFFLSESYSKEVINIEKADENPLKGLGISLNIPGGFEYEASGSSLTISSVSGSIEVVRNNTQVSSLEEYLNQRDIRYATTDIISEERIIIDGYKASSRREFSNARGVTELVVYIFTKPSVYVFSTTSPELYDDLDQIAKSFRYTP